MEGELKKGQRIRTTSGFEAEVIRLLGEGGQGFVYEVNYKGMRKALKWYKPAGMGTDKLAFYKNLMDKVEIGPPSAEFVWPLAITEWYGDVFGYIMDLIPSGYHEIGEYMLLHAKINSFKTIIDASLHIISAFRVLHNLGYSYQDLNDGNFLIEPKTGKVLICDNDNVAPNGEQTGILGKPRYMAPEIVMHKQMPDNLSDRFSMFVIIYILFCLNHPLEGRKSLIPALTDEMAEKLYGSDALFMMDPNDHSNAPDKVIHANTLSIWPYLPDYMQALFIKSFSQKALFTPSARPKELDWIKALVRFRSEIVSCSCGNEVFTKEGRTCLCDGCGKTLNIPYRLVFPEYAVPALSGSRIYRCQLGSCDASEALNPVGAVIAKKEPPYQLGLRHKGTCKWDAITSKGEARTVQPDSVVPIKNGIQLNIKAEPTDPGTVVRFESN